MLKKIAMYLVAAILSFPYLLSAQSMRLANSSSGVAPPLHFLFRLPSAQYDMEQSVMHSGDWFSFISSDEGKRLRRWVITGGTIGMAAGVVVACVRIASYGNTRGGDGLAVLAVIPVVTMVYAIAGMYVGGVAGLIGYFIFDFPKRDSRL